MENYNYIAPGFYLEEYLDYIQEGKIEDIKNKVTEFFSVQENLKKFTDRLERKGKQANKDVSKLKKDLSNFGVDVKKIESAVTKKSSELKKIIKSAKDPKAAGSKLNDFLHEIFHLDEVEEEASKTKVFATKFAISFVLFIFVLFIEATLSITALTYIIDTMEGLSISEVNKLNLVFTGLFIAPVIEEAAKYISVKVKATGEYFITFAGLEFLKYVIGAIVFGGMGIGGVIGFTALRLIAVGMHAITTYIIFAFSKMKEKKKHSEAYALIGLGIGIIIHFLFNTAATKFGPMPG